MSATMPVRIGLHYDNTLVRGRITFRNVHTEQRVTMTLSTGCEDFRAFGLDGVIMDTGTTRTTLPLPVAKELGIGTETKTYRASKGAVGCGVGFTSHPIEICIMDEYSAVCQKVQPNIHIKGAPFISCKQEELDEYAIGTAARFGSEIIDRVCPRVQQIDSLTVKILPTSEGSEVKPVIYTGLLFKYILIGRDWQRHFRLTFLPSLVEITPLQLRFWH